MAFLHWLEQLLARWFRKEPADPLPPGERVRLDAEASSAAHAAEAGIHIHAKY